MARCTGCGREISPGAPFCGHCGTAVDETPQPEERPLQQAVVAPIKPTPPAAVATPVVVPIRHDPIRQRVNPVPWLIAAVVAAVGAVGFFFTQDKKAQSQSVSQQSDVPAVVPSESKPSIPSLKADPPFQKDGMWYSTVHWEIKDAVSAEFRTGSGKEDDAGVYKKIEVGPGSMDVVLGAEPTTATISAYDKAGKSYESSISCGVAGATRTGPAVGNSSSFGSTMPAIEEFRPDLRTDTALGTAVRISYKLPPNTGVHLMVNDVEQPIDANASYGDYFITRKTDCVLKVETSSGEITKDFEIAPDPKIATQSEQQETGPPLCDSVDVVSAQASSLDFTILATLASDDPLAGWLNRILHGAPKEFLNYYANGIFARHGYIFKRDDLKNIFIERTWYKGDTADASVVEARFNDKEKANVKWLLEREKSAP